MSHRVRRGSAGLLAGLSLAGSLQAQALPGLGPGEAPPELPAPELLLPLRPFAGALEAGPGQKIRFRGERVAETAEAWLIEQGAAQSDDLLLLADRIRFEPATGILTAEGRIRLEGPGLRLRCERLRMDWHQRTGEAWALDLEVPPHWTLRAAHVAFTSLKLWDFQRVDVTACPEERPGWTARLSSLKVDLEGFATLRNLWLWLGPIPTYYYLPWGIYPAKAQRSSGLLPLSFSPSGPMGWNLSLPYFQTLGDRADFTLSPDYHSRQGVLWGGELRWNPEVTHQGSFKGEYIHQRSNGETRYRYALKELWQREDGWQVTADLNSASDALLDADYGRGVGGLGVPTFDSGIFVGRSFRHVAFSVSASEQRAFYQPEDPFYQPDFPASLRRRALPEAQLRLFPVPLFGMYLEAGARLSRFSYLLDLGEENPDSSYAWNRGDLFARAYGQVAQVGPLRADLQVLGRYTAYGSTLREPVFNPDPDGDDTPLEAALSPFLVDGPGLRRSLASGRLQVSGIQVGRVFQGVKLFGYQGDLKHILEPYLAYTQNSRTGEAGRIPRFDEVDSRPGVAGSADGERSIELGLRQHIFGRAGAGSAFSDLVRWRISTRFHLDPILLPDGRSKRGWASLDNDIDIEPSDRIRLSFRRSADMGSSDADNALSADFTGKDGNRLSLAVFSTGINRFLVRQQGLQLGGLQRFFGDRYRLEFQVNYDSRRKEFTYSQVALSRVMPCLAVSLRYSHVAILTPGALGREDRLDLNLTLRSLGDLFSLRR